MNTFDLRLHGMIARVGVKRRPTSPANTHKKQKVREVRLILLKRGGDIRTLS